MFIIAGFVGSLENVNPYVLESAVHGTNIPILATESRPYEPLSGDLNNTNFFFVRRTDETEMQVCAICHFDEVICSTK